MSFLRGMPGTRNVTVICRPGEPDEQRISVPANVQTRHGFFSVDVPILAGDIVEEPDPRPGMPPIRRSVKEVEVFPGPPQHMAHIETTWGAPPAPQRPKPRPLEIAGLHSLVQSASSALYGDGHGGQAVFEAFKAIELRIRAMSSLDESGTRLVGKAFGGDAPMFRLSRRAGRAGDDEHDGRRLIITGALTSVRNLGAHETAHEDQQSALELLGLASQIMRWLDEVEFSA